MLLASINGFFLSIKITNTAIEVGTSIFFNVSKLSTKSALFTN